MDSSLHPPSSFRPPSQQRSEKFPSRPTSQQRPEHTVNYSRPGSQQRSEKFPSRPASQNQASSVRSRSPPRKEPSYAESALSIAPSPPLTSSLHSRNSASSATEQAYLRQSWWLRFMQIVLSVLVLALGTTVLACEGHALRSYNVTHLSEGWHLPLWPIDVDIRPTLGAIVPAAIATAAGLLYLLVAFIPSPHSRTTLLNVLFIATSTASLIVTLFSTIFGQVLVHDVDPSHARPSLQSFTCTLYRGATSFTNTANKLQLPVYQPIQYPPGFKRICIESEVGYGMMVALFCVEVGCVTVAAIGVLLGRRIAKERSIRKFQGEKWEA